MAIKFSLFWEMNYHLLSERQQEQRNGKVSRQLAYLKKRLQAELGLDGTKISTNFAAFIK
jgi:hypothetical protein